jgi:CubicO group peptidase (beta-lactamase class C family)
MPCFSSLIQIQSASAMPSITSISLILPLLSVTLGASSLVQQNPCPPLLGGGFPVPTAPSTSEAVEKAKLSFAKTLKAALKHGSTEYGSLDVVTTSFSINVFSAHENTSLYNFHYEAPGLNGSLTAGKLSDNTIYRIGSVSKLITLYTLLGEAGLDVLQQPVTKYIPELAALDKTRESDFDPISQYAWSDITLGALASHLAGLVPDGMSTF